MAIVNITADSFSGDGVLDRLAWEDELVANVPILESRSVAMVDIGAFASFPGATAVPMDEELARIERALVAIGRIPHNLTVSVDTFHEPVARRALDCGAGMINSIWGLRLPDGRWNEDLSMLLAESGASIVLAHNRLSDYAEGEIGRHCVGVEYGNVVKEVRNDLLQQADFALARGIDPTRIVLDPGIGQGKTPLQNQTLLQNLDEFANLGYRSLIAVSRKSVLGLFTGQPKEQRDGATAATTALGVAAGISYFRVHNTDLNMDAMNTALAMIAKPSP